MDRTTWRKKLCVLVVPKVMDLVDDGLEASPHREVERKLADDTLTNRESFGSQLPVRQVVVADKEADVTKLPKVEEVGDRIDWVCPVSTDLRAEGETDLLLHSLHLIDHPDEHARVRANDQRAIAAATKKYVGVGSSQKPILSASPVTRGSV